MGHDKDGNPIYKYDDFGRPVYEPPIVPPFGEIPYLEDKNGNKILDFNDKKQPIIGQDENGNDVIGE